MQCTGDSLTVMHHYANVMFNVMRGGIFIDNYNVEKADLCAFIEKRNTLGSEEWSKWLSGCVRICCLHRQQARPKVGGGS